MSLLFRSARAEQRTLTYQDVFGKALDYGRHNTDAGVNVTPDSALRLGAVWACVTLLADTVATMPVDVYRGSGPVRKPVDPQPSLVSAPSLIVSRREWVYQAMVSLLLRGNAYGLVVERDKFLRPTAVEWLSPDEVSAKQESSLVRPTYKVGGKDVPPDDVIHIRAYLRPGSAIGMSPIENHAETVGVGLAAQKFGAQWFGDGAHPSGIMQHEERDIAPDKAAALKQRLVASFRRSREPLVVGKGWAWQQVQVAANESQFLESQRATVNDIARIFKVPAEKVGGSTEGSTLNYSSREQRNLDLLTDAVQPWLTKCEDTITSHLARPQYVKFNTDALLRSDTKTRLEVMRIEREIGRKNVDELRELDDLAPLPNGQGQDYTPLKSTGAKPNDDES